MLRASFNGSPFLGVFAEATEDYLLVAGGVEHGDVADELEVDKVYSGTLANSGVVGSTAVANSNGVLVSDDVLDHEIDAIQDAVDVSVERFPGPPNAVGNFVLANDDVAAVSPGLDEGQRDAVGDALVVEVHPVTLGGLEVVGSAGVATANGVLCHPRSSDEELDFLEDVFDVHVDVGTVNYGTPLVGSGLLANTKGYVAGTETTGPELGRIEETLGFV